MYSSHQTVFRKDKLASSYVIESDEEFIDNIAMFIFRGWGNEYGKLCELKIMKI